MTGIIVNSIIGIAILLWGIVVNNIWLCAFGGFALGLASAIAMNELWARRH